MQKIFLTISLLVSIFAILCQAHQAQTMSGELQNSSLELFGSKEIQLPTIEVVRSDDVFSCRYGPLYIFEACQNITGTVEIQKNNTTQVCLVPLSLSQALDAVNEMNWSCSDQECVQIDRNESVNGSSFRFEIHAPAPGTYVLISKNSSTLQPVPIMVMENNISVTAPDNIEKGDLIEVAVHAIGDNLTYGAVLVSLEDYKSFNLTMKGNGSSENTTIILARKDQLVEIPPAINKEILMNVFPLIPENSAVQMGDSAEFYLITDDQWTPGSYILTCAVYSSSKGLVGIDQKVIQVL